MRKRRKKAKKTDCVFRDWDQFFMSMAFFVGMKSKDPSTKVGAVVVGPKRDIRSTGYNGLPRGMKEKPSRLVRPCKYHYNEHGERNSLYHASGTTQTLDGCTMYTPWVPCCDCARGIIQSGISEVVVYFGVSNMERWAEQSKRALCMLREVGIKVRWFKGEIVKTIYCQMDGKRIF